MMWDSPGIVEKYMHRSMQWNGEPRNTQVWPTEKGTYTHSMEER